MNTKTSVQRSILMSKVRQKNTGPELIVRKALRNLGYKYSLHSRKLPGTPDIVIRSNKIAFFVHGCFWHRHTSCKYSTLPKSNQSFWIEKFSANKSRDKRVSKQLIKLGWSVITIWQCQTRDFSALNRRLANSLSLQMNLPKRRRSSSAPALKSNTKRGAARKRYKKSKAAAA